MKYTYTNVISKADFDARKSESIAQLRAALHARLDELITIEELDTYGENGVPAVAMTASFVMMTASTWDGIKGRLRSIVTPGTPRQFYLSLLDSVDESHRGNL